MRSYDSFVCPICSRKSYTVIDSYKHHWLSCNDCGNVFRRRKDKYLIPRFIPRFLGNILFTKLGATVLYPEENVIQEEARFYDAYHNASGLSIEETKWFRQLDRLKKNLAEGGVEPDGRRILDISGGPGFTTKELSKVAEKAVVTEFSQVSADGMKKNLQIEAVKYDYNTDKLEDIFQEKFDLVIINYSINFCTDLPGFIASLKHVLMDGAYIYVSFVPPTLGCCLRWQHDEYTYNVLYHPETMGRIFAEAGCKAVMKKSDEEYYYMAVDAGMSVKEKYFKYPYVLFYLLKARKKRKNINRELIHKNDVHIYQYHASS